jgi:multidrug efflux pump subunit AcrA (membrane-fusion protein)
LDGSGFRLLALAALVFGFCATGCNGPRYQRDTSTKTSEPIPQPTAVRVVSPKPVNAADFSAPLSGIVKSKQQVAVAFQVSGSVESVPVNIGDPVKRGTVIAVLDKTLFQAQRDQAAGALAQAKAQLDLANAGSRPEEILALQAQVDSAQAVVEKAQADYDRAQKLFAEGVIPKQTLDAAYTGLVQAQKALEAATQQLNIAKHGARDEEKRLAEAAVQTAQAALAQADAQLSFADLKAPFNGTITLRNIEPGQVISAGLPVLELADLGALEILTQIPEARFAEIKLQQAATITLPVMPQLSLSAIVSEVAPKADQATRAFTMKLKLKNAPREVLPGMVALVQFQSPGLSAGLCIPRRCLIDDSVYVVSGDKAAKRKVQILADQGNDVVVAGLAASDQVVLNGQDFIKDGETVRVVEGLGMERLVELGESGQTK